MHTIDFYTKVDDKLQAVFIILYSLDGKPWEDYVETNSPRKDLIIPTCLMNNRAYGNVGFIGGKVDEGETLETAIVREVKEEIGHNLDITPEIIVAHDIGPITTHAFAYQMSYRQLRQIQKDATNAEHFGSEVTGLFLPHLIDYDKVLGKGGGMVNLIKTCFEQSVREELMHFLLKKNIFTNEDLSDLCTRAGYSLDSLLK